MSRQLSIHPLAAIELEEVIACYEECRRGLGRECYDDIKEKVQAALQHPAQFSPYRDQLRRLRFRRWPYIVVFGHDLHRLAILGVFHAARDPRWIAQQLQDRE